MQKILEHLKSFLADNKIFLIKDFADSLPVELVPTLDEAFLWDIGDQLSDEELYAREWNLTLREVERGLVKRKIQDITDLMRHADTTKREDDDLRELTDRLKVLEKEG